MVLAAKFRLDCDKVHQYTLLSKWTLYEEGEKHEDYRRLFVTFWIYSQRNTEVKK